MFLAQLLLSLSTGAETPAVDFRSEVLPIFKARCVECHQDPATNAGKRPKGGLRLDGKHWILKGTRSGPVIVAGDPSESTLYELVSLDPDDLDRMPPESAPLSATEVTTLRTWIAEGASFGDWVGAPGPGEKPESTPKPRLIAMGIRKRACMEVSKIIGAKPKKVVNEVSMIGRNLRFPAI